MTDNKRLLCNKKDFVIIAVIVVICLCLILIPRMFYKASTQAVIKLGTKEIYRVTLSECKDKVFTLDEIPQMKFEISNHRIRVVDSDCHDKICVRTGYIDRTSQVIVCLPNQVTVLIEDNNTDSIDIVI